MRRYSDSQKQVREERKIKIKNNKKKPLL